MTDLQPCPFCGGTDVEVSFDYERGTTGHCNGCEASGPYPKLDFPVTFDEEQRKAQEEAWNAEAASLWNRRAPVSYKLGEKLYTLGPDGLTVETQPQYDLATWRR